MISTKSIRPLLSGLATIAIAGAAWSQTNDTWTNGSGDNLWETPGNWTSGGTPTSDTIAIINSTGDDRVIVTGITAQAFKLSVGDSSGAVGTIEMTSGKIDSAGGPGHQPMRIGVSGGTGYYIQHDGEGFFGGNRFQVGVGAGSIGVVDIHGGTFDAYRGYNGNSLHIGEGGTGLFNVYGGTVRTRTGLLLGSAPGVGTFVVHGSTPTEIGVGAYGSGAGAWNHTADSVLKILIDESGVTPVHVDNSGGSESDTGSITFANGALLEVGFIGSEQFGTWVAMNWDEGVVVTDNGLSFVAGTPTYQWSFVIDETNRELRITRADNPPPTNTAPNAVDDQTAVGPGRSYSIDVLFNDSDADADPISILSVGTPEHGAAQIVGGEILYTASEDFSGTDTFTYTVSDGQDTSTATVSVITRRFIHPGLWHTQADLDRMKAMIAAKKDPWYGSFLEMQAHDHGQVDYEIKWDTTSTYLNRENPCVGCYDYEADARAAYIQALMWNFTGDERHAINAIEILNVYSKLTHVDGIPLGAGIYGATLINAAELMRYTYDGWAPEDIAAFEASLVYPGWSNLEAPGGPELTWYWKTYLGDWARAGNQDALCYRTVMNIGAFLDNEIIYERGLRYFLGLPHREDDLPYPSGPPIQGAVEMDYEYQTTYAWLGGSNEIEDYGYNGQIQHNIYENGQNQESDRDQSHTLLGIGTLVEASELAWNQGDDMYSHLDHRILLGLEYSLRYNVSYDHSYPDQPEPWEPVEGTDDFIQRLDRTGRTLAKKINPYVTFNFDRWTRGNYEEQYKWEMPTAHYEVRLGLPEDDYKWTKRARDTTLETFGYEITNSRGNHGHASWGSITARRPVNMAGNAVLGFTEFGLPIHGMPGVSGTIRAAHYDHFATGGTGRTYVDLTEGNSGGVYRDQDVDLAEDVSEGVYVTDMENGEWLTYSINVEKIGNYAIKLRYAAANGNAKVRFSFDGEDSTDEITLPATGGATTFAEETVVASLPLDNGAQAMRIFVSGESNVLSLSEITVEQLFSAPGVVETFPTYGGRILVTWDANETAQSYNLYRSSTSGGPYTLVAEGLETTSYFDESLDRDVPYYYVVKAFDGTNESGNSPEASATSWTTTVGDYQDLIFADVPNLYYTFDETEGNLAESIAQAMPFGLIGEPDLAIDGVVGSAIQFLAANDSYGTARSRPAASIGGDLSISFWLNIGDGTGDSDYQTIIAKGSTSYQVALDTSAHTLRFSLRGGTGGDVDLDSTTVIPVHTWVHVVAVHDLLLGEMRLYINGLQDPSVVTRSGTIGENGSNLTIGNVNLGAGNTQHFNGSIDDLALYPSVLAPEIIAEQFAAGEFLGIPTTDLWCSFPRFGDWADTGDFIGWLYVGVDPWIWSTELKQWLYLPECPDAADRGVWAYIVK